MWIGFLSLLIIRLVSSEVLRTRVPASEAFDELEYPCAANCGSGSCFPSAWDDAAAQSKALTAGCTYVLYSVAVDDRADSFNPIDDYWGDPLTCSILFLSKNSLYLQRHVGASKVGNWNIVAVDKLTGSGFSDGRKASRVPKLSPGKFFADTAQYALYIDAKLKLLQHPTKLLSTHVVRSKYEALALIGVYPNIRDLKHEVALIASARANRPNVTHDFGMLEHQAEVYATLNITGTGMAIDGALIMVDLKSPAAKQFACMWFNQVLRYSDRDQMAFQGALWYFSHRNNDTIVDADGYREVALDIAAGRHYLRMLPRRYWWNASPNPEIALLRRLGWNKR
jgi:hypothetical protein